MPSFVMLGRVALAEPAGQELDALLRQPKRLALLAYLALPRPGTWHRRDTLLSVFWPDLDTNRGRTALRNALYVLRQHLGEGVLRTRGDEEVSLDPGMFSTDVALLEAELAGGDSRGALARYTGELLPALFIPGAEGFEKWLDGERQRVLAIALRAALTLIEEREAAGDLPGAIQAATRATELDPDSEPAVRRLMELHDRAGSTSGALAAYERFRTRVREEYGAEPSPATAAIAERIRMRSPGPATRSDAPVAGPPLDTTLTPESAPTAEPPRRRWGVRLALGGALVLAGVVALRAFGGGPATPERSLVILPMENVTGDRELDYISAGVAEDLAARLARMSGLARVHSAARAEWPRETLADLPLIGREFGASLGFRSRLVREGDSLGVAGEVIDLATGSTRSTGTLRFTPSSIPDLESRLLAVVFGTAFRRPVPEDPRPSRRPVDPESYRLTLKGWQQLLTVRNVPAAAQFFLEATRLDPSNARAWAGVSSVRSSEAIAWGAPFEEGMAIAEAAANRALALDSLQGTALANLAVLRGIRDRSLAAGDSLFARAIAAEPANAEIFLVQAALYRHAWQWDRARDAIRIARQLDPLSALYAERESVIGLCAGRPELALEGLQVARRLDPSAGFVRDGLARALAQLRRWDDALEVLGAKGLRGEAGYWTYRAAQARPRLEQLLETGRTRWISRARLGTLYIAAGEVDRGLDLLEAEARAGDIGLYRLPCQPDVDRVRAHPRFIALLEFVGRTRPR